MPRNINFNIDSERHKKMGTLYVYFNVYATEPEEFFFPDFSVTLTLPDDELFTSKAIDNCESFFHNLICEYMGTVDNNCIIDSEHCYYYIRQQIMENGVPDECKQPQK